MAPNELRLDNWVLYDGRPFKIYGISKEYPFLDTIEFGAGVVEWKDLQPIPLTEEILFNCGFELKGTIYRLDNGISTQFDINFSMNKNCFYYDKSYRGLVSAIKVIHLNQLQNLYWCLCGKELTVNLQI